MERLEAEPWPKKKVRSVEVNIDSKDDNEVVEVEEIEKEIEQVDDGNNDNADSDSAQQVSIVWHYLVRNTYA